MRFSEAIRLGAMTGPQGHGRIGRTYRKYWLFGPVITETCAMGAAIAAAGCGSREGVSYGTSLRGKSKAGSKITVIEFPDHWLKILHRETSCPEIQCNERSRAERLVTHLNDDHKWTREQIAEWIETLESTHENVVGKLETVHVSK